MSNTSDAVVSHVSSEFEMTFSGRDPQGLLQEEHYERGHRRECVCVCKLTATFVTLSRLFMY